MKDNKDEVVIVTGGARGIGREYCHALSDAGYRVVVADLDAPELVAKDLQAKGGRAIGVQVDVADEEATAEMASVTMERFGRIDGLVNNAAYFSSITKTPFQDLTVAQWEIAHRVNVIGTWLCARAVFPHMRAAGYGKIVNTSSMTVATAVPGFLHYVASKSAIVGLTRALAHEVGAHGIAVNTISPCYIPHDQSYVAKQAEGMGPAIVKQRAFKREMVPHDLVGTLLYLVGHDSDFVTGQNLYVNGGRAFT